MSTTTTISDFLEQFSLVEEVDIAEKPGSENAASSALRVLYTCDLASKGEIRAWFAWRNGSSPSLRVGLHAPSHLHATVQDGIGSRLKCLYSAVPTRHSSEPSLVQRLPFPLSRPTLSSLTESAVTASELSAELLTGNPETLSNPWYRILLLADLVRDSFDQLGFSSIESSSYTTFHRDYLIRLLVLRAGKSDSKALEIADLLSQRATALRTADRSGIRVVSEKRAPWVSSVVATSQAAENDSSLIPVPDPFAPTRTNVVLFQSFHVLANTLRLQPLEEALAFTFLRQEYPPSAPDAPLILTRPPLEPEEAPSSGQAPSALPAHIPAPWMLLVRAGHENGKGFLEVFDRCAGAAYKRSADALLILRDHSLGAERLAQASYLLNEVPAFLAPDTPMDVRLLLNRFFLGSLAYLYYLKDDLALAEKTLDLARDSLEKATDQSTCLASCVPLNADIPLQRARIARRRADWASVGQELSLLADMETGRQPLYRSQDGRTFDYDTILEACSDGARVPGEELQVIRRFLVREDRISRLNRIIRSFYAPKGLLVTDS